MVLGSSMKRLLMVNDAYGSEVVRLAILDEINNMVRKSRATEIFMAEITACFETLHGIAKEYSRNKRIMREVILAEHASLSAFVQRMA